MHFFSFKHFFTSFKECVFFLKLLKFDQIEKKAYGERINLFIPFLNTFHAQRKMSSKFSFEDRIKITVFNKF